MNSFYPHRRHVIRMMDRLRFAGVYSTRKLEGRALFSRFVVRLIGGIGGLTAFCEVRRRLSGQTLC